jgi:hypothetical protein
LGKISLSEGIGARIGRNILPQILDSGHTFDFIDDRAIAAKGIAYRMLILPGVERIPLATLQRIREYASKGGLVLAVRRLPALAPGLQEAEADTPRIRELSARLFPANALDETQLGAAIGKVLPADATLPPEVGFVHRSTGFADIYFLANTSNRPVRGRAAFRVKRRSAQWWDPFSGKATGAPINGILLDLAPYESRVLVFSDDLAEPAPTQPGTTPAPIDLSNGWSVTFPDSSRPTVVDRLQSWTVDPSRRYYAGRATYQKTFTVSPEMIASKRRLYLNFGEGTPVTVEERRSGNGMRAMLESPVREAAVVSVNGRLAGSVWRPPYEIDASAFLHVGENTIRVVVANLAMNALAKGPLPDYKDLTARYGERFQQQDMIDLQPLPSGMLGPVRLIPR